ncbi:MAG: AAA family ATPase [Candidatus Poribacteria bacterium]|nr:AAA family ATPase [Candidatus Poribacteria bacterium]
MKLRRLKLKNLNSFRDEVEIDFEKPPLDDASLVAITGPTGAGKTTLLDAICVALYGKTPRLTGRDTRNPKHLISHGENEAFAEVYFEANSKRYHATWTIKRNYSPKTQLFDSSGALITTDVSQEIESILGLNFAAFNQSVMLAQGQFAAFLKAGRDHRRTILETTADIGIYDVLRQTLLDKVNEVSDVYDEIERRLEQIPEASPELIEKAEVELDNFNAEAKTLGIKNQQIQDQKDHETDRKDDFETLQSSEERLGELTNQQPIIDKLKSELERAERANELRAEKQVFDSTKSDHQKATEALRKAETELADTQKRVKTNQTDFDKKEEIYTTVSTKRDKKIEIYADAKSDVERAAERFAEVNKRTPTLEDLNEQIETTSSQLSGKQTEQGELQEQIAAAETFLNENPLPSDRQSRFNRTSVLLSELNSKRQQQKEKMDDQSEYRSQIDELEEKLKELTENRKELRSEEKTVKNSLKQVETEFKALQGTGTLEEWQGRRDNAIKTQSIVQQYENFDSQLCEEKESLAEFQECITEFDESLDELEKKLEIQSQLCKRSDAEVEKLEAEKELAILAEPVNVLRQRLEEGKPCRVCGATDHPYANEVESEALLESIEKALDDAETEAKKAQKQKQKLEQNQVRLQQDKSNTTNQINACQEEIENLNSEIENIRVQWQELYESADISSKWVDERLDEADTAIKNLKELDQVSQELATCERDHKRESDSLNDTKQEFETVTDKIEVLKLDISDTEKDFWESMPKVFHDFTPSEAVKQFEDKIEKVATRDQELTSKNNQLDVLNTEIQNNQRELSGLQEDLTELQNAIKHYQNEAEKILEDVREKTDGLETENEINDAITKLEMDLQVKKDERYEAEQQLDESCRLLIQKEAAQQFCEGQLKVESENFEKARDAYLNKLDEAGFELPEAHNAAFRDDTQMQALTEKIDAHESEKQQLDVKIVALRTQFEETPFDLEALKLIISQVEEIAAQIEEKQQEIGAQQQIIDNLKDALKKREKLADELQTAKQEMERWQRLQNTISANALRDFALEIIFKQMGLLANQQLKYLTSERYQLKVESIGDLTVIDRWNANEKRPVETLSGGESFLTSLALALALSELSQGRAQLNSLFLDEGFGTLDAETLDIAIAALEGLQMQGRSIYLISHIQELTRRLPVKIKVKKRGDGSSYIDTN